LAGEVGFDGGGEEQEDVAALLAAGFNHAEHRFDEAAAGGIRRLQSRRDARSRMDR